MAQPALDNAAQLRKVRELGKVLEQARREQALRGILADCQQQPTSYARRWEIEGGAE